MSEKEKVQELEKEEIQNKEITKSNELQAKQQEIEELTDRYKEF